MKRKYAILAFCLVIPAIIWFQLTTSNDIPRNNDRIHVVYDKDDNKLSVWPDPVSDVLHIQTSFAKAAIEIYDPGGKIIWKCETKNPVTEVYVSSWQAGIYIVYARSGDARLTTKFVKR